jgi:hypothetical protein
MVLGQKPITHSADGVFVTTKFFENSHFAAVPSEFVGHSKNIAGWAYFKHLGIIPPPKLALGFWHGLADADRLDFIEAAFIRPSGLKAS